MLALSRMLPLYPVALLLLAGCVTLPSDFKQPGVAVVSITPKVLNSISPQFEIVLHLTNPNRSALDIAGLSYSIDLAGNRIIEGVASDLPKIAAYGESDVTLQAKADLLSGIRLLSDLLDKPAGPIEFEFNAQIDIGTFYPMIHVNKRGVIDF